jgi:ribosomal protein S18 acetylase RimI-like enzyme
VALGIDDMIREVDQHTFSREFFALMAEVECGNRFDFSNPKHVQWLKDKIQHRFDSGARFFASYLDDGTAVGFSAVRVEPKLDGVPYTGQYSEVVAIGVIACFRRGGHGSNLLKFSEAYGRAQGAYCQYVVTYAGAQDTIAFYQRNGFEIVATLPDVHGPKAAGNVYLRKILRR